jgi:hypothetical protein
VAAVSAGKNSLPHLAFGQLKRHPAKNWVTFILVLILELRLLLVSLEYFKLEIDCPK